MAGNRGIFILPDGSSNGTTPINARLALAGLLADDGVSALSARVGVFYDGQGNVVSGNTDTGTMSYSVRACQIAQYLLGVSSSGIVAAVNDAVFKAVTTTAPGSNSRIDVIWVRQHAVASDGGPDTTTNYEIGVTQGTPAASPTVPALPFPGCMALAQAIMPAGATSTNALTITQVHNWTTTHGSAIPVRNQTERDAMTPFEGMFVYRLDTGHPEVYDGTRWHWSALTYVPVWGSSGTAPTLGNGTLVGNYTYDGSFIDFDVTLTLGSTSAVGTGNYTLTVPVAPIAARHSFNGWLLDASTGNRYAIIGEVNGAVTTINLTNGGFPIGLLTAAAPVVPAVGDVYRLAGRYRWQ